MTDASTLTHAAVKYVWNVERFSTAHKIHVSKFFGALGRAWQLSLPLNEQETEGRTFDRTFKMVMFDDQFISAEEMAKYDDRSISVIVKFGVQQKWKGRNDCGVDVAFPHCFSTDVSSYWQTKFSTAELNDPEKGYLVNDKLVIEVCLSLDSPKRNSEMKAKELHKRHQLQLLEYLEQLHESPTFTDMEIEVEKEKFPVHRVILAQAPFFRTMFSSEVGEGTQQSSITLPPANAVTAAAFRVVLVFLYNVRAEALVLPKGDVLLEVHTAARFFMLELLESMCIQKIEESLGADVLVRYLRYAHLHDLKDLKEMCLEYAAESKSSRLGDIMADFIAFPVDDQELYMEMVQRVRSKKRLKNRSRLVGI